MKKCSKCKIMKPFIDFYKDLSRKDGYQNKCNSCKKLYYKYIPINSLENKEIKSEEYIIKNRERSKNRYINNRDKCIEYSRNRYINNREVHIENCKKYIKNRLKTDSLFKLSHTLRKRTRQIFKNKRFIKPSTKLLIGEDLSFVKKYLENQFIEGMSWKNHGKWHIDHIIPLSSANNESELIKLCHYTNLQPLWAFDNLSKGNKIL